jgi:hypothetical protein
MSQRQDLSIKDTAFYKQATEYLTSVELGDFSDAPVDNKSYARRNRDWVEVTAEGGSGSAVVTVGKTGCDFNATGTLQSPTDHQTIQAAINSVAQAGGQVFIAAGTYYLGATINISTPNIAIVGSGRATELRCVGDYGNVFLCALPQPPAQWPGMSGLQFSNLRFETTVERTSGAAIRANYTHNAIFRDLYICDSTYGVSFFQPGTYPQAGAAFYDGIYLDGQDQCHVSKITGSCSRRCIHVNGSGYANADFSYDGYIENCDLWGQPGTRRGVGIYLGANCGGFVVDFVSLNQFQTGIYADAAGTVQGGGIFTIRGGYAENSGDRGYYITGYQNTVVEQLWGELHVIGGNLVVTGVVNGSIKVDSASALIYGTPSSVSGTGTWKLINTSGSEGPQYEIKSSTFSAVAGKQYLANTTSASVQATLPAAPAVGAVIEFADAKGTWGTNALVVAPNGKKIEGSTSNFSVNVTGAFFSLIYIDSTTGWRVLVSAGIKPLNIGLPTVSGSSAFTATSGGWTGNPSSYSYQWQMSNNGSTGWANINGETTAIYTSDPADAGKYVRVGVTATNTNGQSSVAYSSSSVITSGSGSGSGSFPSSNLVAFYKLDNTSDASGNGNTLTNNNSTTFVTGKIGNAANFSDNSLSISNLGWNLGTQDASVSMWFNASSVSSTTTLMGFYDDPGFAFLFVGSKLVISSGAANILESTVAMTSNTWTHIAFVKNSSNYKLYLNGALNISVANNGDLGMGPQNTVFYFGDVTDTGLPGVFIGKQDAIGFWNRALTDSDISALYNSGNGLEPS